MSHPRRALAAPLVIASARVLSLAFAPPDVSLGLLLALDLVVLLLLELAVLFGQIIGAGFGSVALTFIGLGLPIAGLGAAMDTWVSRDASDLSGMLALLGVGVGFCLAAPTREERFDQGLVGLLGVGAFALGTKLLLERHGLPSGSWLAAPYGVVGVVALVVRPRSPELRERAE